MSSKRAREHKDLVAREKEYHHQAGIHWYQHRRTRSKGIQNAVCAESAYEWHKREKQNPEFAQELNELFNFF